MKKLKIVIDIDGCICNQVEKDYALAQPNLKAIETINRWYYASHKIVLHTARFMNRNKGNAQKAIDEGYEFTVSQLKSWGVKYHELILGKPSADIAIDDRAVFFKPDWDAIDKEVGSKSEISEIPSFDRLKGLVYLQNMRLPENNLVILSEGNVSQVSEDRKFFAIKPSGIPYEKLQPQDIVVLDISGNVVDGHCKPSTDTPIHLALYQARPDICAIVHTHSPFATIFAQQQEPIPCYGTTHADAFGTEIPVTRALLEEETTGNFELATAKTMHEAVLPNVTPAVLVASHGPFTFGRNAQEAVDNAVILEKIAMLAFFGKSEKSLPLSLFKRHFERKHGPSRYYGQ